MDENDRTALESRIAHLERTIEELSDVIARQDRDMQKMERKLDLLIERQGQPEADGGVFLGDQRPPHW